MFINEMDLGDAEEIIHETSGVVGMIKSDLEENKNLSKFAELSVDKESDFNGIDGYASPINESELYEDNPFWEADGFEDIV